MKTEQSASCDAIYQSVINLDQSDNYILFKMADCFIKGYDLEKLRAMIKSRDSCHVSDALFILGEIGQLTKHFIPEISEIANGSDEDLASDATRLLKPYT